MICGFDKHEFDKDYVCTNCGCHGRGLRSYHADRGEMFKFEEWRDQLQLARRAAHRWLEHPQFLGELKESLEEIAEPWPESSSSSD